MMASRVLQQITIELTNECTQACVFCSSMSECTSDTQLSFIEVETVLQEAISLGAEEVAFSGGEPLLYEDLDRCIELATDLGLSTYLYTSGVVYNGKEEMISLTAGSAQQLQTCGLDYPYVSITGSSSDAHDVLSAVPGSFELAIRSLRSLVQADFPVGIHYLVTRMNYSEMASAARYLFHLGADCFKPMKLVLQGRARSSAPELELSLEDEVLIEQIRQLCITYGNRIELGCFWGGLLSIPECPEIPPCKVGQHVLTIKADGSVVPCGAHKELVVGNIHHSSLTTIWRNSEKLQSLSLARRNGPVCAR